MAPVADVVRNLVRRSARFAPALFNYRANSLLPQRLRGGVHDLDLLKLGLEKTAAPLVYDVGANVGQTVMSLKRLAPRARIVAFEPYPASLRHLIRVADRHRDVTVIPAACGERTGALETLYVPCARGIEFTQLAQLGEPSRPKSLEFFHKTGFGWMTDSDLSFKAQPIVTIALDDLGEAPDVIKIDAEGAEVGVLKGAHRCLTEGKPLLFVETGSGHTPVIDFLERYGYRPRGEQGLNTVFVR